MPSAAEHRATAEALLEEGVKVVDRISQIAEEREHTRPGDELYKRHTLRMNELGRKATGTWLQAQAHAALGGPMPEVSVEAEASFQTAFGLPTTDELDAMRGNFSAAIEEDLRGQVAAKPQVTTQTEDVVDLAKRLHGDHQRATGSVVTWEDLHPADRDSWVKIVSLAWDDGHRTGLDVAKAQEVVAFPQVTTPPIPFDDIVRSAHVVYTSKTGGLSWENISVTARNAWYLALTHAMDSLRVYDGPQEPQPQQAGSGDLVLDAYAAYAYRQEVGSVSWSYLNEQTRSAWRAAVGAVLQGMDQRIHARKRREYMAKEVVPPLMATVEVPGEDFSIAIGHTAPAGIRYFVHVDEKIYVIRKLHDGDLRIFDVEDL